MPSFIDLENRFWSKVEKTDNCWNWVGGTSGKKGGYGAIRLPGRKGGKHGAHRVSWFIAYGYMPDLHVLHKCDNKKCVRPSHLFLGTNQDNINDKVAKGRQYSHRDSLGRFQRKGDIY